MELVSWRGNPESHQAESSALRWKEGESPFCEHYWPMDQPCSTAHLVFSDICTNEFPFINIYDNLKLRLCLKLPVHWVPRLISLKLPLVHFLSICYHSFLLFLLSYFPILHSSSEFPLKVRKK